ncbi:zinc-binding dehydrogenase [Kutzneria viridogrisea]|uniref:Alcohol dehydrogenase zinc-binding domain-containing protein n=2 Tax=Kutzneria TaxID=43356 RepID=W5W934_9PSEU|nr:zinc-binding dehydrogenase [Kutzneria albida]AHH94684.1 alcohol dehydrogenase zinc-binding domain-containing protein [Kutzneria albida DSM 43870]MBA8930352.1 NADPH2:quinone reductase [Kutzneria viridogrisea]
MKAIRLHEFGPAENLRLEEVPDPVPAEGQVRIRVRAAGVHLLDTMLRKGIEGGPLPPQQLPAIPGREVAGAVDALGEGVDPSWLGRRVVAHLGAASAGYAELAVANVQSLHGIPDGLDEASAVAMIGTGRTVMGVLDEAAATPEDVVLVTSAAGGMGSLFVQALRNLGATVVAVAGGPEKVARVKELGAEVVADYNQADWDEQVRAELGSRSVTLVLDGVGGEPGRKALGLLGFGGRIVMFGWSAGAPTQLGTEDLVAKALTVSWGLGPRMRKPGVVRELETRSMAEAAAGRLVPLTTRFPLAEAARAHTALENRGTVGKAVLVVSGQTA